MSLNIDLPEAFLLKYKRALNDSVLLKVAEFYDFSNTFSSDILLGYLDMDEPQVWWKWKMVCYPFFLLSAFSMLREEIKEKGLLNQIPYDLLFGPNGIYSSMEYSEAELSLIYNLCAKSDARIIKIHKKSREAIDAYRSMTNSGSAASWDVYYGIDNIDPEGSPSRSISQLISDKTINFDI
jgi:hypothetical protein